MLWAEHHLPVRQVVVYIGRKKKPTNLLENARLTLPNIDFKIEIINLRDIPHELFINSDVPEEVILSILCDFQGKETVNVLEQIVLRLKELDRDQELIFGKHIVQLEVLSDLRNLQPLLTKTIDAMPLVYNMNKDVRFNQGIKEGIKEGIEKGVLLKDQRLVIHLLKKGTFSLETIADLACVDIDFAKNTKKGYVLTTKMIQKGKSDDDIVNKTGLFVEIVRSIRNNQE